MEDFKTQFNLFIPIGRLFTSLFLIGVYVFMIYDFNTSERHSSEEKYTGYFLGTIVLLLLFWMFFKQFLRTTKSYTITESEIREFNFLTLSTKIIHKDEVKGFSTSVIPYLRGGDFKQILIYLENGKKIDLMQFAYFNFKKIRPALVERGYEYLGHEEYVWLFPDNRRYKFDKKEKK